MNALHWRRNAKALLLILAMSLTTSAQAGGFAKTPEEDAMCRARIYAGHDTSDLDNWRHMHHYCDCLRFINRAYLASNSQERNHDLTNAVDGCRYVLGATKPNFDMRPEVMTNMAIALKMLGKQTQAADELLKAIQFNPDYIPAYVKLADNYRDIGDKKMALETATEGLKRKPNSKRLQRLYKELGGKMPYPAPVKTQQPVPTSPVESSKTAVHSNATPTDLNSPHAESNNSEAHPDDKITPATQRSPAKSDTANQSHIGSPSNPWCRFSPPE